MKTIEERAKEYGKNLGYYDCMNQWPSEAFIAGAKSEHEELTRWNSPEVHPELDEDGADRPVLVKYCDGCYDVVCYDSYYQSWVDDSCNEIEIIGWREIHE